MPNTVNGNRQHRTGNSFKSTKVAPPTLIALGTDLYWCEQREKRLKRKVESLERELDKLYRDNKRLHSENKHLHNKVSNSLDKSPSAKTGIDFPKTGPGFGSPLSPSSSSSW